MELIKNIEELNKRIDTLMHEKTRLDAQREVVDKDLKAQLERYSKEYGVDLSGSSVEECKQLIKAEFDKVKSEEEEKYNQSKAVVELIEAGKTTEAEKLLGERVEETTKASEASEKKAISPEEKGQVTAAFNKLVEGEAAKQAAVKEEKVEERVEERKEETEDDGWEMPAGEEQGNSYTEDEVNFSREAFRDIFNNMKKSTPTESKPQEPVKVKGTLLFDDDDSEDENVFGFNVSGGKVDEKKSTPAEKEIAKAKTSSGVKVTGGFSSLFDDDDDEDDGDVLGFGKMLENSKFKVGGND